MDDLDPPETFTAFSGPKRLARGSWPEVSSAARQAASAGLSHIVVLSDLSGETRDFEATHATAPQKSARGSPKQGVTAREVTLLPRIGTGSRSSLVEPPRPYADLSKRPARPRKRTRAPPRPPSTAP